MGILLTWDPEGERYYQSGISKVVLFPKVDGSYTDGVPWNGVVNVTNKPEGGEMSKLYANNAVYGVTQSREQFKGSIEFYSIPPELWQCLGVATPTPGINIAQQARVPFAMAYRSEIHSDAGEEIAYRLDFVWNAMATPMEEALATINEEAEAMTFSIEFECSDMPVPGYKPTAHMFVDSRDMDGTNLSTLETIIYGNDVGPVQPAMPTPADILALT